VVYSYESVLSPSALIASTFITSEPVLSLEGTIPTTVATSDLNDFDFTPTCQIDPSDCASLYAASSNAMFTGGGINITASPPLLACDEVFLQPPPSNDSDCFVSMPLVQLI